MVPYSFIVNLASGGHCILVVSLRNFCLNSKGFLDLILFPKGRYSSTVMVCRCLWNSSC